MPEYNKFHNYADRLRFESTVDGTVPINRARKHYIIRERSLSYRIYPHFHPYVTALIRRLNEKSVAGLQAADTDYVKQDGKVVMLPNGKPKPVLYEEFFQPIYKPSELVNQPYPVKELDFSLSGAYSVYNWEMFYHVPLTLAIHLKKNGHFKEAMKWLKYIFDPTDDSDGPTPERFWKVKPFQTTDVKLVEDLMLNLSSGADKELQQQTINSIDAWRKSPFRPHLIARYRHSAYMLKAVMLYLDICIECGDALFRQDTDETISEAMQYYVLAASILGPRPQEVPKKGSVLPKTYANLRKDLDEFGNALVQMESDIPFNLVPHTTGTVDDNRLVNLRRMCSTLYFCIPRNDKLMSYWDTVADRLFKIRNSLNLRGIFRQLPLFDPPIDPALLAKATAAGLDVGAIISGTNQPLSLVRFQLVIQKAAEICEKVMALARDFLAAMEKEDNEALAVLRAQHEHSILKMVETVKYQQWQETLKNLEGLERSFVHASNRYKYYEQLLGVSLNDIKIPTLDAIKKEELKKMNFKSLEPELIPRDIPIDIANDPNKEGGGHKLNQRELTELERLRIARSTQEEAADKEKLGSYLGLIPDFTPDVKPIGLGIGVVFGGSFLSKAMSLMASFDRARADKLTYEAGNMAKLGSYARREQEWAYQSTLAAMDINQIYKQIRAAQIRESISEQEWYNHKEQIKFAAEIENFLSNEKEGKATQKAWYTWMKRELKGLYAQCFQFAFDMAKKAERVLQHEMGDPTLSYLQVNYLAGKEGLFAGEKLYLDIKRMELAYLELNQREYELTKNVSLLQVDPNALLELRTTGRCTVNLPEELFDMDGAGHYFRRIKSVAISIPCVTGPYTSVNCTLTLLKSTIRTKPLLDNGNYRRSEDGEDDRFNDYFGSLQSIVTSTGQNDSGMFELNLRDERYLPFEGSGVISQWQLELPADFRQFDYDTISDIILHIRYTAREGGKLLRDKAIQNLLSRIKEAEATGTVRLFSLRHDFPNVWAKFKTVAAGTWAVVKVTLKEEHYPYWSIGRLGSIKRIDVFAQTTENSIEIRPDPNVTGSSDLLELFLTNKNDKINLLKGTLTNVPIPSKPADSSHPENSTLTFYMKNTSVEDLLFTVTWGN